jgi:hypothetical protein
MSAQLRFPVALSLHQDAKTIYIAYLDSLLKFPAFWYDKIEQPSAMITPLNARDVDESEINIPVRTA